MTADRSHADWDGATYDRIADPMTRWGSGVLERLPLRGDETVLDAGCGSGRVTEQLLERLPDGRVVAADAAPSMLVEARRRLERFGDRVRFVECDLGCPLPVDGPVDAVFSTATFHWVPDHEALFANLAAVLRPGGRLVAQCGGAGNLASVQRVLVEVGEAWPGPWTFATPEETSARLAAAGFVDVDTWLQDEPTVIEPGEPLEMFLRTVILRSHLERRPEGQRDDFVRAVADRLAGRPIDYVRLNIMATRA
ncbi:MAG TPA: methyltransferase domain-containing protein [Acidimicrobiales bacterium]|nr:methyltransferase domain-containing protein [Acidimicrobiales bacterium]